MVMNKKGAELSMNVVVIAALAMLVLVVLGVIFLQGTSEVPQKLKGCVASGGQCVESGESCPVGFSKEEPKDCTEGTRCCISDIVSQG
jgi:hypothetical protein